MSWHRRLKHDAIASLMSSGNEAVAYFVKRDLLGCRVNPLRDIWALPEVRKKLAGQRGDGSWKWTGSRPFLFPSYHHDLLETFKRFRDLVMRYELSRTHASIERGAEYLFSCQTKSGDIRGMLGNQYATYYTGEILALLIRAGYAQDARVQRGMRWLLGMRQGDGGWNVPLLTHRLSRSEQHRLTSTDASPLLPDRAQPFSCLATDMVLRAFAAHPRHRRSSAARTAGVLLKRRFLKPDTCRRHRGSGDWVRFQFWWPNLLTSLESLSRLGFTAKDPDIARALDWFAANQEQDGLWRLTYESGSRIRSTPQNRESRLWLGLAISRMLKRYWH